MYARRYASVSVVMRLSSCLGVRLRQLFPGQRLSVCVCVCVCFCVPTWFKGDKITKRVSVD